MRQTEIDTAGNYMRPFNALAQMQQQRPQQPSNMFAAMRDNGGPTVAAANALAGADALDAAAKAGATPTGNGGVNLGGVNPQLREVIEAAMVEAGEGWRITEGMRTQERQAALYAQGRTAPGNIVTNTLNSQHIKGNAIDVALIEGGKANWDFDRYGQFNNIVQRIAQQRGVPVTWGGGWKMRDGPHFQIGG